MTYVAVISEESRSDFSIHFPDVPGCFTRGATRDQACRFAGETLAFHLERFAANGLPVPSTRTLETLRAQPEHRDATLVLVEATALAI
jgi:predicted RNase H-like HicB family nuclease